MAIDNLLPLGNLLLVHLRPGVQELPSGLVIPPGIQQITQQGDVLRAGPDAHEVKPGDLVLLDMFSGTQVGWKQNTPVILVPEDRVQAILEP